MTIMKIRNYLIRFFIVFSIAMSFTFQVFGADRLREVSFSMGLGAPSGGSAEPYISALYTSGFNLNEYIAIGLSTGFELGLTAQLSLRSRIPFSREARMGAYLSANGGASFFLDGTIPLGSVSLGIFRTTRSGKRILLGPYLSKYYTDTDDLSNGKGRKCGAENWLAILNIPEHRFRGRLKRVGSLPLRGLRSLRSLRNLPSPSGDRYEFKSSASNRDYRSCS